jgi:hypothetical protein
MGSGPSGGKVNAPPEDPWRNTETAPAILSLEGALSRTA